MMKKTNTTPHSPYAMRGETDTAVEALNTLTQPLSALAHDVAKLVEAHGLETAEITLSGDVTGSLRLTNDAKSGLSVSLKGSLATGDLPETGVPYFAHYNGEFFWRPTPDSDDFVKSGDTVRAGQLVGWAMGESKDMSFGLRADRDGVIRIVAAHATKVKEGETLLYRIEDRA